ncbi:nitrogen fixation protein NifQ [Methylomonas paludis]|nr:nitrogen fixation protein NifQ [Methylomonas paludis]
MIQNQEPQQVSCLKKSRQQHYEELMACAGQSSSKVWLAQMISSWLVGAGVLPDYLGLQPEQFRQLLQQCFSGYCLPVTALSGQVSDFSRMLEKQDLEQLLSRYANPEAEYNQWLISIIVTASLGSDHLWQDMGLWSRQDLTAMLARHFPELTVRNSKDMKWKKFLYKQLCEAEGLYVCRAPSCEVCLDYHNCFGAEV